MVHMEQGREGLPPLYFPFGNFIAGPGDRAPVGPRAGPCNPPNAILSCLPAQETKSRRLLCSQPKLKSVASAGTPASKCGPPRLGWGEGGHKVTRKEQEGSVGMASTF